jgi:hypothetical protein
LALNGHATATVSEPESVPGASGPGQDIIIIDNYHYRVTGVAHESVTLPTAAAAGTFTISFDFKGVVFHSMRVVAPDGGEIFVGRNDGTLAQLGSMSGTWTQNADGTTLIHIENLTNDMAIHQTEIMAQSGMMGPQSWSIDAVTHAFGFGDGSVRGMPGEPATLDYMGSTNLTDQIRALIAPMQSPPPGVGAPTSYLIDAQFVGTDMSQEQLTLQGPGFGDSHGSDGLLGTLNGSATPSWGGSIQLSDTLSANGFANEHVIPTLVLPAPTALAPSGTVYTTTPTFSWTAVSGADFYFLTIIDQTVPEVIEGDVIGNSFTPGPGLLTPGHTYIWFVQALDSGGDASDFSNTLEFSVAFGSA